MAKYKKGFFVEMNMQNPPKAPEVIWYVRKATDDSVPELTVCGYEFTEDRREDSIGKTEAPSMGYNFRRAFLPEEGHYWLSRDFSGQELRIMANISGEAAWIEAFKNGEDIHKATAIAIWGEENYTANKRKMAKAINFGILYGSTAVGIANSLSISEDEAEDIIQQFFEKLPSIKAFLNKSKIEARETKATGNLYGRKRRMHNFINAWGNLSPSGQRRSFNHPIQSLGADIMKIALIKLYNNILTKEKYKGKIIFMNTIHDEVNLSVEKSIIEEATKLVGEVMEHRIKGKPIPIITGIEIGHNMGVTFKFNQDLETLELTPDIEPLD